MAPIAWSEDSIFDSYTIFEETYKTIDSHDVKTAILLPKNFKPGSHPLAYHLHGGFLVTAHGLFAPFFPKWLDKMALEHGAIIVSLDYRLLPSANGVADLLEDLEDGWQWTKSKLPGILAAKAPGHTVDFSQTLLAGGSAGGYCSVQLALSHPNDFQTLAAVYPMLDPKDRLYVSGTRPGEPNVLHFPAQDIPSVQDLLAWIEEKRQTWASRDDRRRTPFAVSACQNGYYMTKIFDNRNLNRAEFLPMERLEIGAKLPPRVWLMHGDADTAVPIRGTRKFVGLLQTKQPDVTLRYDEVPGQDHAFDFNWANWDSFADDALAFVVEGWIKK